MRREVKFRGLGLDKKWYVGDLRHNGSSLRIEWEVTDWKAMPPLGTIIQVGKNVKKETIGQYTGLKDKNGKEIYEGDVVEFTVFNHNDAETQYKGVVKYRSGLYEVWKNNDSEFFESDGAFILNFVWLQDDEFTVIGNIYENPELLK